MRSLRAWGVRLLGVVIARRREREFDEELESHLQMHIDDNLRAGMTLPEARRLAYVKLGGVQRTREAYHDRVRLPALDAFGQDLRFAARMLRKSPGFTAVAVIVLALGIGANAAMFSLVNAVLFRPLNGGSARGELVGLYGHDRTRPDSFRMFSYPEYLDVRRGNRIFAGVFAEWMLIAGLDEGGLTTRAMAGVVSSDYFSTLGVKMAAGRDFTIDEETPGRGTAVVVVSYAYWKRRGLGPRLVGTTVDLNGRPFTIVGVAPEGFNGTMAVISSDIWLPLGSAELVANSMSPHARLWDRSAYTLLVGGVLRPGLTPETAEPLLVPLAAGLAASQPEHNANQQLLVRPLSRVSRGPSPRSDTQPTVGAALFLMMSALVLVVACLNLANMLLAKGSSRRQEIAIRLAVGGGRTRIIRQLLTEGMLLSVMGAIAALVMAGFVNGLVVSSLAQVMTVPISIETSIDIRVVLATAAACVASTLVFGLGPAWKMSRLDVMSRVKQPAAEHVVLQRRRLAVPDLLSMGQIALSLALVVAAGLFMRAGARAAVGTPGFELDGLLIAELNGDMIGYEQARGRETFVKVVDRVRELPTSRSASLASIVPFGSTVLGGLVERDGADRGMPAGSQELQRAGVSATFTIIGTDYFASLGLPVLAGREFSALEERSETAAPVAVIDRLLAERLFPGENPLGQAVRVRQRQDSTAGEPMQIVGIVGGVRDDLLQPAPVPHIYFPFGRTYRGGMTLHVKTHGVGDVTAATLEAVRDEIRSVDARLPVLALKTMTAHRDESIGLWAIGLAAKLFAAFGASALLLATVGVYGLRAYLVAQRARELGIRTALGATPRSLVRQIMGESLTVAFGGLGAGFALALALSRLMSRMLYELGSGFDPLVLAIAPILLAGAVGAASYVPERRVLRLDPIAALRSE